MSYKKPSESEVKAKLTPAQYEVTQCSATEPPFRNEFWNHHEAGIYVDVVSGGAAVVFRQKVGSGPRLAELHAATRKSQRDRAPRRLVRDGARGGAPGQRRLAPGPPVPGRPWADGPALLHQLGVAALHSRLEARGSRVRAIQIAVRQGEARPLIAAGRRWGAVPHRRAVRYFDRNILASRSSGRTVSALPQRFTRLV